MSEYGRQTLFSLIAESAFSSIWVPFVLSQVSLCFSLALSTFLVSEYPIANQPSPLCPGSLAVPLSLSLPLSLYLFLDLVFPRALAAVLSASSSFSLSLCFCISVSLFLSAASDMYLSHASHLVSFPGRLLFLSLGLSHRHMTYFSSRSLHLVSTTWLSKTG